MHAVHFGKVMIIGRGLIGGSLALDMAHLHLADQIVYHDFSAADSAPLTEIADADLVIFATPVETIPDLVASCQPYLSKHTILMDVASTKSKLIERLKPILGAQICQFVLTHPIAGKAKSGFAEAEAGLFKGKSVIIMPLEETQLDFLAKISAFWQALGAAVTQMQPEQHDAFYGRYSHLSNLLAFVLKAQWQAADQQYLALLPPSFLAMTRLAASSPMMWRDICLTNQEEILKSIHAFQIELNHLEALIQKANPRELLDYFEEK
jgi:prephenate dehydrogenase